MYIILTVQFLVCSCSVIELKVVKFYPSYREGTIATSCIKQLKRLTNAPSDWGELMFKRFT